MEFMNQSLKLGRLFGINIGIHYTWFFIFAILAWALATDIFPYYYPDFSKAAYWTIGIISSLLLFVSVLFHELSHSLAAKYQGIKVESITLFFFGGVASIEEEDLKPVKEMTVAMAGPLFSIFIAFVFFIILITTKNQIISAISFYLSRINIILAFFNMIPGFPLDGGRVLRGFIYGWTNDLKKATKVASLFGKGFAVFLIILGIFNMLFLNFGGMWYIFIGLFLYMIAEASYEQLVIRQTLASVSVTKFMSRKPDKETVSRLLEAKMPVLSRKTSAYNALQIMIRAKQEILPVGEKNKIVGIVEKNKIVAYLMANIKSVK